MSTSSSFIILRQDLENKDYYLGNINDLYESNGYNLTNENDLFNKIVKKEDIPQYISAGKLKYVDHFSGEIYDVLFSVEFNSSFSSLIEEFNMSQYGVNDRIIISLGFAEQLLEAVNYLLSEKYDRNFEDNVLENDYIRILGETYTPYYNFYNPKNRIEYDEEYKTQQIILKRIKIVLDAFIEMSDDNSWNKLKHVLIYRVY